MSKLQKFLIATSTILFLNLSASLPIFAQEKHFGINPIPKEYLEIGAGMSLQDERGNTVFSSTDKHCDYDNDKFCYLIQDTLYGQPKVVSPIFRRGDGYERVILVDEARTLLVTFELKVIDELWEGIKYNGFITIESSNGLTQRIKVAGYEGS
jgi:hypothetical protein